MEVDERPTEQYSDIGGLDKQIEEVILLFDVTWAVLYEARPVLYLYRIESNFLWIRIESV